MPVAVVRMVMSLPGRLARRRVGPAPGCRHTAKNCRRNGYAQQTDHACSLPRIAHRVQLLKCHICNSYAITCILTALRRNGKRDGAEFWRSLS